MNLFRTHEDEQDTGRPENDATEQEDGDESFLSELDWDDIAESFIGTLAAALFVAVVFVIALRGGRLNRGSRIRRFVRPM